MVKVPEARSSKQIRRPARPPRSMAAASSAHQCAAARGSNYLNTKLGASNKAQRRTMRNQRRPAGGGGGLLLTLLLLGQLAFLAAQAYQINGASSSSSSNNNNGASNEPPQPPPARLSGESEAAEPEGGLVFDGPSSIRPNEDPENKVDIVQRARKNEFSSEMVTNRTRALVSCETGEILVKINFTEPFRGVAYADYDRASPCKFFGEGGTQYELRLPLKGCGTKQEAPRLFVNNIVLRFHRSLELEEDEEKTIVCRYPPPQAPAPPPPPGAPARIIDAPPEPAKLTQYEPFVLIAGLLFFALLLAGIGTTSYVVKKETLKPINTPLPVSARTEFDDYIDTQTVKEINDLQSCQKLEPLPKLTTHTFDDVYITNLHEIDTIETLTHHKQAPPVPAALERHEFEEVHLTNQEEIISQEMLQQQRLAEQQRALGQQDCDDFYLTNEEERLADERTAQHRLARERPKLEMRTIEDTFITNVDEIIEHEDTTYHKNHGHQSRFGALEQRLEDCAALEAPDERHRRRRTDY